MAGSERRLPFPLRSLSTERHTRTGDTQAWLYFQFSCTDTDTTPPPTQECSLCSPGRGPRSLPGSAFASTQQSVPVCVPASEGQAGAAPPAAWTQASAERQPRSKHHKALPRQGSPWLQGRLLRDSPLPP